MMCEGVMVDELKKYKFSISGLIERSSVHTYGTWNPAEVTLHRKVVKEDEAFFNWINEVTFAPPYRHPEVRLGFGESGIIIEFYEVLFSGEKDGVFSADYRGRALWFECPRSGGLVWDSETTLWAMEWGVYDFLARGGQ
jgi:hypothetical protein